MKRLSFILLLLLFLVACGQKSEIVKPSRLLTEQEMMDIMTDVQILEADINHRKSDGKIVDGMAESYYSQLFEHYGITDSIFNENMRYYTHQPATLERIMDSVTQRLTKESRRDDSQ